MLYEFHRGELFSYSTVGPNQMPHYFIFIMEALYLISVQMSRCWLIKDEWGTWLGRTLDSSWKLLKTDTRNIMVQCMSLFIIETVRHWWHLEMCSNHISGTSPPCSAFWINNGSLVMYVIEQKINHYRDMICSCLCVLCSFPSSCDRLTSTHILFIFFIT